MENPETYKAIINGYKDAPIENLTFDQRIQVEQVRLLKIMNGKMTFFVILAVIAIILQLLFG